MVTAVSAAVSLMVIIAALKVTRGPFLEKYAFKGVMIGGRLNV